MMVGSPRASGYLSCPLPSRERATPTESRTLMGEGANRFGKIVTPHPTEFVESLALPSPARGEGAATRASRAVAPRFGGALP